MGRQQAILVSLQWMLLLLWQGKGVYSGTPAPELFFREQLVDHVNSSSKYQGQHWSQRYYIWEKEFRGPGSPIFVILGGEGNIEPETGLFYPFVTHHLAKIFGAYVLEPEHRFYGKSQPVNITTTAAHTNSNTKSNCCEDPRVKLFTPEQALLDAMRLIDVTAASLGCSRDKFSKEYCPVVTIGGSYPGWLSAMARVVYPHKVDMAYAASAPMGFYAQQVNQYEYYDLITKVAEDTLPGCADVVRSALLQVKSTILEMGYDESTLGICVGSTPSYLNPSTKDGLEFLIDELMMVIEYTFANANMANYPPSNTTRLAKACTTFVSKELDAFTKVKQFLSVQLPPGDQDCWSFTSQLPGGPHATITSGDWSGVGSGTNGESWDWQTCTLLVEAIGLSKESMFPPRDWSMSWLNHHCFQRFGVIPRPFELVHRWGFDQLVQSNVTRILFTNGLKDGWSVGAISQNLSDSLIVLNFPNGAHHSDLSGRGPSDEDTEDIQQGFRDIIDILGDWLNEVTSGDSKHSPYNQNEKSRQLRRSLN